jgi:hypothetical protein
LFAAKGAIAPVPGGQYYRFENHVADLTILSAASPELTLERFRRLLVLFKLRSQELLLQAEHSLALRIRHGF